MKRFAMALALMCALSTSIFAGNMPTDGRSEPPPHNNVEHVEHITGKRDTHDH